MAHKNFMAYIYILTPKDNMTCPPETEVVVGVDLVPFLRDLWRHQQVGCCFTCNSG